MKRRILVAFTAVGLLAGVVAAPALAAPYGPARYQVTTNTYSMAIGYGHTYMVEFNPCGGGSVTAAGWQWGSDGDPLVHNPDEAITAALSPDGTMLTFDPVDYVGGWGGSPYSWSGTFPVAGGTFTVTDSLGGVYENVAITLVSTTATSYKNHGEYVSAMGGGADAAHSCVGMPMKSGDETSGALGADALVVARLMANKARLLATLEVVLAKHQVKAEVKADAVTAITKHVDEVKADSSGHDRAAKAVGKTGGSAAATTSPKPAKPAKPTKPTKAQDHPNAGNHPGKP